MAPVLNRLTISLAGSTSSRGMGLPAGTNCSKSRSMMARPGTCTDALYSSNSPGSFSRTARCSRLIVIGLIRCSSPSSGRHDVMPELGS